MSYVISLYWVVGAEKINDMQGDKCETSRSRPLLLYLRNDPDNQYCNDEAKKQSNGHDAKDTPVLALLWSFADGCLPNANANIDHNRAQEHAYCGQTPSARYLYENSGKIISNGIYG